MMSMRDCGGDDNDDNNNVHGLAAAASVSGAIIVTSNGTDPARDDISTLSGNDLFVLGSPTTTRSFPTGNNNNNNSDPHRQPQQSRRASFFFAQEQEEAQQKSSSTTTPTPKTTTRQVRQLQAIQPRSSDSFRHSLERATQELTMTRLRFSESTLYGRQDCQEKLHTILSSRRSNGGCSQVVWLTGTAGVGKSAVARQLVQPLIAQQAGFFLGGKFDYLNNTTMTSSGISSNMEEPYSAFTMACRELVDQLLAYNNNNNSNNNNKSRSSGSSSNGSNKSENHRSVSPHENYYYYCCKWKFSFEEIQAALRQELMTSATSSDELQVLTSVFPDLAHILGDDHDYDYTSSNIGDTNSMMDGPNNQNNNNNNNNTHQLYQHQHQHHTYQEAKNRFNHAFRKLIQVLRRFGRVVLFLDDLQWADAASLDLFKSLLMMDITSTTTANNANGSPQTPTPTPTPISINEPDNQQPSATLSMNATTNPPSTRSSSSSDTNHHGLVILASYRSDTVDQNQALATFIQELEQIVIVKDDKNQHPTVTTGATPPQNNANDNSLNPTSFAPVSSFFEMHHLEIGNLTLDQVNDMLVDLLTPDSPQDTLPLAECVHRKTLGNTFYVIQFLKSLVNSSSNGSRNERYLINDDNDNDNHLLLYFDMGTFKWKWNVKEIKLRESATINVVDMIQQKLELLPLGIQKILPITACLGASFQYSVFERVLMHFNQVIQSPNNTNSSNNNNHSQAEPAKSGREGPITSDDDTRSGENENNQHVEGFNVFEAAEFINICEREGLLVYDQHNGTVKWDHDKIQEAALSLANAEETAELRYKLGDFLMQELDQNELESSIFTIANLLDQDASNVPKNNPKRTMLAELNHTAGQKALNAGAFSSAAHYLARGVHLLPEGHWETHYLLSLRLYSSAAEAHHCTGKVEAVRQYCNAVCARDDIPILDKKRAYNVLLHSINSQGDTVLAQEKCLEVLAMLGCTFPKYGWVLQTLGGILNTELSVKSLEKKISRLPVMTDQSKIWTMHLLDILMTFAFQNKSDIFPLVIFKGLKYTLKYGLSEYSPPLLCTVGLLLAAGLGDLKGCNTFGELSLSLLDRKGTTRISQATRSRTLFVATAFCLHWQVPTIKLRKLFIDGYKSGLACGDVESALWCIFCYLEFGVHNGVPLGMLEKDCQAYVQQMKDLKQEMICRCTQALWQLISRMLGHDEGSTELNDAPKMLDKTVVLEGGAKAHVERLNLMTTFWSGDYGKTAQLIEETGANKGYFDKAFTGSYGLAPLHFQCAIACFAMYQDTKKKKYKQFALWHSKHVQDWAKKGNPNAAIYASFIKAEISALKKRDLETIKLFKEAITLCGRMGILHDQALANERLGEFFLRADLENEAHYYLQEAFRLFKEWGATGRAIGVFLRKDFNVAQVDLSCLTMEATASIR